MKKYIVSAQVFVKEEVEANSLDEARFKFKEEYPQHKYPEFFDCGDEENVVYGYCENTGLPIFEHDNFEQDSEGVMWLVDDRFYTKGGLINSEIPKLINEKMKLELKHIASYLPYGLKFRVNLSDVQENYKNELREFTLTTTNLDLLLGYGGKPILRPLSDLTKEINGVVHAIELGKLAISIQKPERLLVSEGGLPDIGYRIITKPFGKVLKVTNGQTWLVYLSLDEPFRCHHYVVQYLFQHHFDVYGLIDKGLAIDINTIENV